MNTRNTPRFDYSVLHETGEKVLLDTESSTMDDGNTVLAKLKVEELKVQADINYQLEVNKLEDLKSVDEVVDALDRLFFFLE